MRMQRQVSMGRHQFFTFSLSLCYFFFLRASLSSSSRTLVLSLGWLMIRALRFCFPLEMDFSDLAFLLRGLGGLLEGSYCSVRREQAGICVLVSLMRAAKVSSSFSNIILFLRHSFSSWLRLKLTSFTLSLSSRPSLPSRLDVIRFTHTSIFLSSYDLIRFSNSRSPYPSYSSESSYSARRAGAKVQVARSYYICRIWSLTCLLRVQYSFIRWSSWAQLA